MEEQEGILKLGMNTPPRNAELSFNDMSLSPYNLDEMIKIPLVEGFSPEFTRTLEAAWTNTGSANIEVLAKSSTVDESIEDSPVIRGFLKDDCPSPTTTCSAAQPSADFLFASTPLMAPRPSMNASRKLPQISLFGKYCKENATFEVKERHGLANVLPSPGHSGEEHDKENQCNATFDITSNKTSCGNGTFNVKNQAHDNHSGDATFNIKNVTFDTQKQSRADATFDLNRPIKPENATFTKAVSGAIATCDVTNNVNCATNKQAFIEANLTFDIQNGATGSEVASESKVNNAETSNITNASKGSSSDVEMLDEVSTTSKCSVSSQVSTKSDIKTKQTRKLSKLAQPRMNAAARSRILAGSPVKSANIESASTSSIGKPTQLQKPAQIAKKSGPKKSLPRKSLLPPPTTSNIKRPSSAQSFKSSQPKASNQQQAAVKRKAPESPKRTGRSAKFASDRGDTSSSTAKPQFKKPGLPAPTSSRVNSAIPLSSRSTSTASSRSRPQKPCNTTAGRASIKITSSSTANLRSTQQNVTTQKLTSPNARFQYNKKCALAMSTLLNYVVNELDGLSAPRLSTNNSQLEKLLKDKSEEYDNLRENVSQLNEKLNATTAQVQSQREDYEETIARMTKQHAESITNIKSSHEQEMILLKETIHDFEESMDQKCEQRVQELVQPYLDAHAENESLRTVLEMKNKQIHDMQSMECKRTLQDGEIRTLQDKLDFVQHKNEDLSAQLTDKTNEYNELMQACGNLRRSVDDEQNRSLILHQENEQLMYRLNSVSPSASSFNPVFEASPNNASKNHTFSEFNDPFRGVNHCDIENNNKI